MIKRFLMTVLAGVFFTNSFALSCRCEPNQACWPKAKDWSDLEKKLTGRLLKPLSPLAVCEANANSQVCKSALKNMHNPFYIESNPGATQSQGWANAWNSKASIYAVEAETAKDVALAVNFARIHHLKLAIKGTGHDYLGRSSAPNSLLIWTHKMRQMQLIPHFIPEGCPRDEKPVSAITIGAGTRWLDVYNYATTKHHQYVQGGGCTTVGAAGGFTQGGGFGSYSKKFGTGAAGILEAEIITANGEILTVNKCQHADLFWAIRGGGGGTFGVVTKMTLKTHPLPNQFGVMQGVIFASNDAAYKKLIKQFSIFFRDHLNNEHWGEQFSFNANNTIKIFMLFQNLTKEEMNNTWQPFIKWIKDNSNLYTMHANSIFIPADKMWDYRFWQTYYPSYITLNKKSVGEFWWANNGNEVSEYWYTYQSWWLPLSLFKEENIDKLAELFFKASRFKPVTLHINKGLAGASSDAIKDVSETATNPAVTDAAALVIMGMGSNKVYPGVKGLEPDNNLIKKEVTQITNAVQLFKNAAPNAGTYVNEADYFQSDWQTAFWGSNYAKLLSIKKKYDPEGVFYCHHCVGSELWIENGMCPL